MSGYYKKSVDNTLEIKVKLNIQKRDNLTFNYLMDTKYNLYNSIKSYSTLMELNKI